MSDHSHYEELAALAAGGHLSGQELTDFQRHVETCADCESTVSEFREVVRLGLPLARSPLRRSINMITSRPDPGARERFIRRASLEGIAFSPSVRKPIASRKPSLIFAAASAGLVAAIVIGVLFLWHQRGVPSSQVGQLSKQNSNSDAKISRLEQTNAELQRETEGLRNRVATLTAAANSYTHNNDRTPADTTQLASGSAGSLEDADAQRKAQEKVLEETRTELAALKKARASDQASIVADQVRISELSDQLKAAKANTTNMQRQLVTATGDVPSLMGARQLHVVDVRDSGPDGKPGKAFGRIFLTEGKSLVFYAFDLNDPTRNGSKKTYQVWGQTEGRAGSVRSLGFLNVDNKAQQRWVLKSNDAATFKEVNSLFVTVEPQGGAKTPSGQRLLFAYLGEANHP
jgi:hypothetical protein